MASQTETAPQLRPPPRIFTIPPPLMFAAAFAIAALIQWLVPLPSGGLFPKAFYVGAAALALGICLAVSLAASFLVRKTTLNPFGAPSSLMAGGAYRLSRNPMYLSLTLTYLGGALMYGSAWPLLLLLVPLLILQTVVIPFEEARMSATFGEQYRSYCRRVRRWI